jgi:hypothetical protein
VSHSRTVPKGTDGKWEASRLFQVWPKKVGGIVLDAGFGEGRGVGVGVGGGAGGAAIIFTAAEANLVGSALLLAVTVAVPVLDGAV